MLWHHFIKAIIQKCTTIYSNILSLGKKNGKRSSLDLEQHPDEISPLISFITVLSLIMNSYSKFEKIYLVGYRISGKIGGRISDEVRSPLNKPNKWKINNICSIGPYGTYRLNSPWLRTSKSFSSQLNLS